MIDLVCRLRPIMIAVTLPGGVFFLALPGKIGIDWYRGGGCLGILFWLFVFLFGLAGLAYFIPVRIRGQIYHCHGVRCEEDSRLVWQVALFGGPPLERWHITLWRKEWTKAKTSGQIPDLIRQLRDRFWHERKKAVVTFEHPEEKALIWESREQLRRSWKKLWRVWRVERWHCRVTVGMGEAGATGRTLGWVWALLAPVSGWLANRGTPGLQPQLVVQPLFQERIWVIDIDCIIRLRLGDVMIANVPAAASLAMGRLRRFGRRRVDSGTDAIRHGQHQRNDRRQYGGGRTG